MWTAIAVVSGLASLAGYGLFQEASGDVVAFVLAFAAGAILTMLADTMMPEAYEDGGKLVGRRDDARLLRRAHDPRAVVNGGSVAQRAPALVALEREVDQALEQAGVRDAGRLEELRVDARRR